MGLNLLGLPRKFNPHRVSPGNLAVWCDYNNPRNGGVALSDADGITIAEDLANPGRAFYDPFTTSIREGWTNVQGTLAVSGGTKGYFSSDTHNDKTVRETGLANGVVSCTLNGDLNSVAYSTPQMLVRYADADNHLLTGLLDGAVTLWKLDAGVGYTQLATAATTTTNNTDYRLQVVMNGNAVTVYVDGTSKFTHTLAGGDTKYAAYTKHGLRLGKVGTPSFTATWDDFVVAKLTDHVQSIASQKLAYTVNAKNSRAAGRATAASSQRMQTATFATAIAQPFTVVVAGKFGGNAQTLIDGIGSSNQARIGAEAGGWTINGGTAISGGSTDTNYHVFVATFNGASSELRVDGTQEVSGDAGAQSLTGLTIAANQALGSFLDGDELVALVYEGALSESQKRRVESYYGRLHDIAIAWA